MLFVGPFTYIGLYICRAPIYRGLYLGSIHRASMGDGGWLMEDEG